MAALISYLPLFVLDLLAIFYLGCVCVPTLILLNGIYLAFLHSHILRVRFKTLRRDLDGLRAMITIQFNLYKCKRQNRTVSSIFYDLVRRYEDKKVAMIDVETGRQWTFRAVESFSNQVANYFQKEGYRKGDVVALYMNNCLEYVCIWLGLSKLGVISALVNYNLRDEPLGHSISAAKAKGIIVGGDLQTNVAQAIKDGHVESGITTYLFNLKGESRLLNGKSLDEELERDDISKLSPILPENDRPGFRDVILYIYTSGTTGLPKAAVISNARFFLLSYGTRCSFRVQPNDRLYVTMPLYHSAAGIIGLGQCLVGGTTAVIRKKFSASRFWQDCISYECTVSQYIGELCRYLLTQPAKDTDRAHNVRLMFGNGLRADIWEQFVSRFGVKKIGELYGSTEGNTSLVNLDSHPGACGFLPLSVLTQYIHPVALMKIDPSTGQLARNSRGLCIRCGPGESGEILGKIRSGHPFHDFVGYASGTSDTNKKVVRDVFRHGDMAFSSGDVLYMDELGYLYFKDRLGDTFRWKGENVSTTEVEAIVQRAAGMNDATVYGVEVPGAEGKAGMAAIVDEDGKANLKQLNAALKEKLAPYARPVFIRLCKKVQLTGTFKLMKQDLQKSGYDPTQCVGDQLYYFNAKSAEYEELTPAIYQEILDGKVIF